MIQIDRHTVIQVFGSLMNQPSLLNDTDKYRLEISDFPTTLDRFIYSAIYNLYNGGVEKIRTIDIVSYLKENPTATIYLEKENGEIFLQDCESTGEPQNFNYYYNKLKKLNLLKDIQSTGRSIEQFYCEDIFNPKYNEINEKFDKLTIKDIIDSLRNEVNIYENKFELNSIAEESRAVDGIRELIDDLKKGPEIGCKLQGDIFNTVCRGGRKGKLYIRSALSGVGKSRSMVGDACQIAYPIRYDRKSGKWISTGSAEKVLYIMTEQDPEEIKTMILSYLTGYNEEIFLYGTYGEKEMPRIQQAIDIMEKYSDNMLFARIPDPCASVIKNLFRRYHIQNGVENFFYDYIFSSPAMLEEYRDLKLPEHVCLRLFTTALKNLAIELDSFVLTSTQVSNEDDNKEGGFRDFRNIRGSRAIVDTADLACIMSRPTKNELNQLQGFQNLFSFVPNLVTDVFKNRGNRWTMVRIWSYNDLGSCRREDLFITTSYMYPIKDFQIIDFVNDNENEFDELLDLYNQGIVSDNVYEEFYSLSDEKPEDVLKDAADAFNDINEQKQRVKEKSFEDLLSF